MSLLFIVYYNVDDTKKSVTLKIMLTKAYFNRQWEIKVSRIIFAVVVVFFALFLYKYVPSHIFTFFFLRLGHSTGGCPPCTSWVPGVFPYSDRNHTFDQRYDYRPTPGEQELRDLRRVIFW